MKTRMLSFLACAWLLTLSLAVPAHATIQASFYVDPVSGSDGNNGTSTGTAFATLGKARQAVDAINASMTGDIMVYLMPGDHVLTSALNLTEADSGTNGHNVIWTAYGARGSARILGGTKVTGWTLDSGSIYKAAVSPGVTRIEAIFENGVRAHLARLPNSGYWSINAKDSTYPKKKFQWKSTNTIPSIATPTDLQVLVWPGNHDWSTEIHDVASLDRTNRWITLTSNIQLAYLDDLAAGSRYYLQGAKELIDQAGEFYYDSAAGYLYYWPYSGSAINSQEVIVPALSTLIQGAPTTTVQTLTGQWQFDDDTSDSSTEGNNGTWMPDTTDAVFVTSQTGLGDALSLDGSTQYVTIPHDPSLEFGSSSNPFSITAWIKTGAAGLQPIICKARPNAGLDNMDYRFELTTAGQLELRRWNYGASTALVVADSDGAALNDGTWHHVAFVNESSTSHKLYVDGALVETSTASWTLSGANDQPVEIGRYRDVQNSVSTYFTGAIDDVRVYTSALGSGDVTAIYNLQPLAASPLQNIAFLNLKFAGANFDYANPTGTAQGMLYFNKANNLVIENNEFLGGSAGVKLSGGTNHTIAGNTVTDMALAGIFCDGITSSLITNNRIRNTAQFFADPGANIRVDSVTDVEVSHNNLSTSKRHGIRMRASTGTTLAYNEVTDMNKDSQDTGAIYWGYADDNVVDHNRIHDSGDNTLGQQHGMYVEDGSDRTVITNNIVYEIGNAPSNGATAPINVKGVANLIQNNIFDFTRSHAGLRTFEIKANAAANSEKVLNNIFYALGTPITFYDFQSYASNRIAQSDYNTFYKTGSGSNVFENIPGTDNLSTWKTLNSSKYDQHSVTADPGFVDAANHNYNFSAGAPSGFTPIDTAQIGLLPGFIYPATAGQWIFSGDTADLTLNGNDGTAAGGSFVADRNGTASSALSLNGSSNYVSIPDNALLDFGNPANPFTIVAWVKTTAVTAAGIVAKARDTNTPNMDYRLQLLATGAVQLTRWNQAAGVTDTVTTTATVNDGAWHHVAFVNESATSHKLYVDGVLSTTSTATWTYDDSNSEPVRLGRDKNGTTSDTYFNGSIDDVAILQAALDANDLLDLNHLPHP